MPLHVGKGRNISTAISDIIDYVENIHFDEADIEPPPTPPSFTKVVFELRERHGFFVHFQAVPFPEVRFSFIFRCSIETPFTKTAEMLSGETELRFRFCLKHL